MNQHPTLPKVKAATTLTKTVIGDQTEFKLDCDCLVTGLPGGWQWPLVFFLAVRIDVKNIKLLALYSLL